MTDAVLVDSRASLWRVSGVSTSAGSGTRGGGGSGVSTSAMIGTKGASGTGVVAVGIGAVACGPGASACASSR
jgi:hypothetical protein